MNLQALQQQTAGASLGEGRNRRRRVWESTHTCSRTHHQNVSQHAQHQDGTPKSAQRMVPVQCQRTDSMSRSDTNIHAHPRREKFKLEKALQQRPQDLLLYAFNTTAHIVNDCKHHSGTTDSLDNQDLATSARQALLVVESRYDGPATLPQNKAALKRLCQSLLNLYKLDLQGSSSVTLQSSEPTVNARLCWPNLQGWICSQVLQRPEDLDSRLSSQILQLLSCTAYSAPPEVMLVLTQGLLVLAPPDDTHDLLSHTEHDAVAEVEQQAAMPQGTTHEHVSDADAGQDAQRQKQEDSTDRVFRTSSGMHNDLRSGLDALAQLEAGLKIQSKSVNADSCIHTASPDVQACLEQAAIALAPAVQDANPAAVTSFCQAAYVHGCVLPAEFVQAVIQAACYKPQSSQPCNSPDSLTAGDSTGSQRKRKRRKSSRTESAAQLNARFQAAALVLPSLDKAVPNHDQLIQDLCKAVFSQPGQSQTQHVHAFFDALSLVKLQADSEQHVVDGLVTCATHTQDATVMATTLHAIHTSSHTAPLQTLASTLSASDLSSCTTQALLKAATAVYARSLHTQSELQLLLSTLGIRLRDKLHVNRDGSASMLHSFVLEYARAVVPAESVDAELRNQALRAVSRLSSCFAETQQLPSCRALASIHSYEVSSSLLQHLCKVHKSGRECQARTAAAVLCVQELTSQCAWFSDEQLLQHLKTLQTVDKMVKGFGAAQQQVDSAQSNGASEHDTSTSQQPVTWQESIKACTQLVSLAIWSRIDHLSDVQLCKVTKYFAKLNYRPAILLDEMIGRIQHTVDAGMEPSHTASHQDNSSQGASSHAQHVTPTAHDLAIFCSSLARLNHHKAAVFSLLRSTARHLLDMQQATQQAASATPLAATWELQQQQQQDQAAHAAQQQTTSQQEQNTDVVAPSAKGPADASVSLETLCSMLWSFAKLETKDVPSMLLIRKVVLSIIGHKEQCNMRQASTVWWSAGKLGLSGARLTAWLQQTTLVALQDGLAADAATQETSRTQENSGDMSTEATVSDQQEESSNVSGRTGTASWMLNGQTLSQTCWGMQQLSVQPSNDFYSLFTQAALASSARMRPAEITQLVYFLTSAERASVGHTLKQSKKREGLSSSVSQLTRIALQCLEQNVQTFQLTSAVHLVWAACKNGLTVPTTVLDRVSQRLANTHVCVVKRTQLDKQGVQHEGDGDLRTRAPYTSQADIPAVDRHVDDTLVSQFMWACSCQGHQPVQLLKAYTAALPLRLSRHYNGGRDARATSTIIADAAFGLGSCNWQPSKAAVAALDAGLWRYHQFFTSDQLSRALYGISFMDHCPTDAFKKGLYHSIKARAPAMTLQDIVHILFALSKWPLQKILQPQQYAEIRAAFRPVLLAYVVGAHVSAAANYDAAGEPTVAPAPGSAVPDTAPTARSTLWHRDDLDGGTGGMALPDGTMTGSALSSEDVVALSTTPGVPFGRPVSTPVPAPQAMRSGSPPLSASSIANLAVGVASLGVCSSDMAEVIAGWAMHAPSGGLSRFTNRQLVGLLWSFATCKHDRLTLFETGTEIIIQRLANSTTTSSGSRSSHHMKQTELSLRNCSKLLWSWSRFNRHPGEELLDTLQAACENAFKSEPVVMDDICNMMYSLAIIREHKHPLMSMLAQQLANLLQDLPKPVTNIPDRSSSSNNNKVEAVVEGADSGAPDVTAQQQEEEDVVAGLMQTRIGQTVLQQHGHIAACVLAAQAEQQVSPLVSVLPQQVTAACLELWRRTRLRRLLGKKREGYVNDLQNISERMGLLWRHEVSPDGMVCPDICVALSFAPAIRFSLELVGSQNMASNSGRLLGDAALKYRLLQARGYLVIPVSCREWQKFGPSGTTAKSMYLQNKLDMRLAAITATGSTLSAPGNSQAGAGVPAQGISSLAPGVNPFAVGGGAALGAAPLQQQQQAFGDQSSGGDGAAAAPVSRKAPARIEVSTRTDKSSFILPPTPRRSMDEGDTDRG